MLFTPATIDGIARGAVTIAYRRWRRLRVRAGSTFRSALGVVRVTNVETAALETVGEHDAQQAGFASRAALLEELARYPDGQLYRIGVRFEGVDPRIALRENAALTDADRDALLTAITRLGARTAAGPWALDTLRLIEAHPATRAAKLAGMMGTETLLFKTRVRQLKNLGLTESLEIGYRLSPRGTALLRGLESSTLDRPSHPFGQQCARGSRLSGR